MPRNTLKSFPTACLRSGLANFHPASRSVAQPATDRGEGGTPVRRPRVTPAPPTPAPEPVAPVVSALESEEQIAVSGAA